MSRKILDFQSAENANVELWGDLSSLPNLYVQGIAHADAEEGVVRLTLYNTSGVVGASGEIASAVARLVLSRGVLNGFISQLQEVADHIVEQRPPTSAAAEDAGQPATTAVTRAIPELGPRIA